MTKVYDCFMYHNEETLLRIHLHELWNVVDKFILVEGDKTHTAKPKPFHFAKNREAFSEFQDKILDRQVVLPGSEPEPWFGWGREIFQRSSINKALQDLGAQDEDIVITGDVDEIVRESVVSWYLQAGNTDPCAIQLKNYHYNLNTMLPEPTIDPKICRYETVKRVGVSDLRYMHQAKKLDIIDRGGWHLSFMGGTEKIVEKLGSYAHYDLRDPKMAEYMSPENVKKSVDNRTSLFLRDEIKYLKVSEYNDLPKYILENFQKFREMKWIVD